MWIAFPMYCSYSSFWQSGITLEEVLSQKTDLLRRYILQGYKSTQTSYTRPSQLMFTTASL